MAGNPPSLWRRLTDVGHLSDRLRPALPAHLELPEGEATTSAVTRRDAAPMAPDDWQQVGIVLSRVAPSLSVGFVSARQIAQLQAGAIPLEVADWMRANPHSWHALNPHPELVAGVIRLRLDGTIPARTQARRATTQAPWQVATEAVDAASQLAARWGTSASQAVTRALTERLAREQQGEASLLAAVGNAAKDGRSKKSTAARKKNAHQA